MYYLPVQFLYVDELTSNLPVNIIKNTTSQLFNKQETSLKCQQISLKC